MAKNTEVQYIKVTDIDLDGEETSTIHIVGLGWAEPEFKHSEKYKILNESEVAEAKKKFPQLFSSNPDE